MHGSGGDSVTPRRTASLAEGAQTGHYALVRADSVEWTERPQRSAFNEWLRVLWWVLTIVAAVMAVTLVAFSAYYLNEVRQGDGCPGSLNIDESIERIDMEWIPGRVVCRSVDLETGTEEVNSYGFTGTYFVPLTLVIPVASIIALRRTRPTAGRQTSA